LRYLERKAAAPGETVLCHNDFRTGNIMVDEAGITGILDWEFAAWGDPHEDIGWLCAKCWRFGGPGEVGGIGPRAAFHAAYEAQSGRVVDAARVAWWEIAAAIRWAVIAIDQAERHVSGREPSLELALTGHIVPELELDVLRATTIVPEGRKT
jgi:aminoglycoside phosphotransferase (APT) family kinase protein